MLIEWLVLLHGWLPTARLGHFRGDADHVCDRFLGDAGC